MFDSEGAHLSVIVTVAVLRMFAVRLTQYSMTALGYSDIIYSEETITGKGDTSILLDWNLET